jgi:hypothetical protein
MKRSQHLRRAICAVFIAVAMACATVAIAEDLNIVSRDLKKLRATGKVLAVLWTVRRESCTLQVVLPTRGRVIAANQRQQPRIQAWLLKADGTIIAPFANSPTKFPQTKGKTAWIGDITYSYPLSAGSEAVAAAISIDDEYYIEQLAAPRDDKL